MIIYGAGRAGLQTRVSAPALGFLCVSGLARGCGLGAFQKVKSGRERGPGPCVSDEGVSEQLFVAGRTRSSEYRPSSL